MPEFVRAVEATLEFPDEAIPIEGVSFVQANVVPETLNALAKVTRDELLPLQIV